MTTLHVLNHFSGSERIHHIFGILQKYQRVQRNTKKTEGRSGTKTHRWRPNCWRNVANVPWSFNYTTMEWSKYQTGLWIVQSVSAQWNCRVSFYSDYNLKFRKILQSTLHCLWDYLEVFFSSPQNLHHFQQTLLFQLLFGQCQKNLQFRLRSHNERYSTFSAQNCWCRWITNQNERSWL